VSTAYPLPAPLTLEYFTGTSNATPGVDYIPVPSTLATLGPGLSSFTVPVTVIGDTIPEVSGTRAGEELVLVVRRPADSVVAIGIGFIVDDD
jgi:hypothetical protein